MKASKLFLVFFIFSIIVTIGCNDDGPVVVEDNFDRNEMLTFWADHIIIPAFNAYNISVHNLKSTADLFFENPSEENYDGLVDDWLTAYELWQSVSIFDIGKAEEISLRSYTNIYPSDVTLIEENITNQNYNLELPSNYDAQGFPALDYLLFGTGATKQDIITTISTENYKIYIKDLVERLANLTESVVDDWESTYRNDFIANDGSSATASVDKLVNDFLFYYEKFLRAGKVGIPAGVFSGSEMSGSVEAPYSSIYSKELFQIGFESVQKFFNGNSFDDSRNGTSLNDYLDHIMTQNGTENISQKILDQWLLVDDKLLELENSFKAQVETDNIKMLELYDALQVAVVFLKVDMMQALNIQVDFVDADGD